MSAQLGDREGARRRFDAAARALEASAGKRATTEVSPRAFAAAASSTGGANWVSPLAFSWLGPRRAAIATVGVVSVVDVLEERIEYVAGTVPSHVTFLGESDLAALADRVPVIAWLNGREGCDVVVSNFVSGTELACVHAKYERRDPLETFRMAVGSEGTVVWGHGGWFSVARPGRPSLRLLDADGASKEGPACNDCGDDEAAMQAAAARGACSGTMARPALSPDATRVAGGPGDEFCIWDSASGTLRAHVDRGRGSRAVSWSTGGRTLAAADSDGRIDVFDDAARVAASLMGPPGLTAFALSPDGSAVAMLSQGLRATAGSTALEPTDLRLTVVDLFPVRERWTQLANGPAKIDWSPDGAWVAVGAGGALYSASDGARRALADGLLSTPRGVRFLSGGGLVVEDEERSRVWATGSPRAEARRIAKVGACGRDACVWDARSDRERLRVPGVAAFSLSDDARWLAVVLPRSPEVQIWEIATQRLVVSLGALWRGDGGYARASDGRIDLVGRDAATLEKVMLCRLGDVAVNVAACRDQFLTPGLLPKVLGF